MYLEAYAESLTADGFVDGVGRPARDAGITYECRPFGLYL